MNLFVCGDVVNQTPGLEFISNRVSDIIRTADYAVCNFEGPEIAVGQTAKCPHQEPGTSAYLKKSGFGLMLLANNHIAELGRDGIKYSINQIKKAGADCIGAGVKWEEAYQPLIRELRGLRFGFLNLCEAQVGQYLTKDQPYGYAWMGYEDLKTDITVLRKQVDFVVVFVHAGLEHYDIPLPEIREFYHSLCDAGATAVIGGHPHSVQGYEYYDRKLIAYSLGNFYFPYTDNRWPEESISYSLNIKFSKEEIVSVTPIHHYVIDGKVELLSNKKMQVDIEILCNKLGANYKEFVREMCENAYHNLCNRLLAESTCGECEGTNFLQHLKRVIRYTVFRKQLVYNTQAYRDSVILRLFENETYRWTIIRAMKNRKNNY